MGWEFLIIKEIGKSEARQVRSDIAIITSGIPDLSLDGFTIDLNGTSGKFNTDSRFAGERRAREESGRKLTCRG